MNSVARLRNGLLPNSARISRSARDRTFTIIELDNGGRSDRLCVTSAICFSLHSTVEAELVRPISPQTSYLAHAGFP